MKKITATEFNRTPGAVIDTGLREGMVAITRHGRVVALLSRDRVAVPPDVQNLSTSMGDLWENLSGILDATASDQHAYTITRAGREVAWLLPRKMLFELGLEL